MGSNGQFNVSRRRLLTLAGATGLGMGVAVLGTAGPAAATQDGWRWCYSCQGLFFATSGPSKCPAHVDDEDESHWDINSGKYRLKFSVDGGRGQDQWAYCSACGGLFHLSNGGGDCPARPAGFPHIGNGPFYYRIEYTDGRDDPGGQEDWRFCIHCNGLYFSGNQTQGYCPVRESDGHQFNGTNYNYVLRLLKTR
jgi:hypothetical protein